MSFGRTTKQFTHKDDVLHTEASTAVSTLASAPEPEPLKSMGGAGIPDALKNWMHLPDEAHVRQPVVKALFACSDSTLWRRVKTGLIPKPHKLGPRITAWNVGELRQALKAAA